MKWLALLLTLTAAPALAALGDPRISGAKLCTQQFAQAERMQGIPNQLLAAISNTESGRWNKTLGMVLPWPWTINAEGKGYYFESKAEAIAKVKALQATGMRSIDIGCMQVNLRHHPDAFANLSQAFDPRYNIAYAAQFLRGHYDEMGDWQKAIGAYHSKTPKYGDKYKARVNKSWAAITGKVQVAREALDRAPRRKNRFSYKVIEVEGARTTSEVKTMRPQTSQKRFSLAMRDVSDGGGQVRAATGGIPLRPQDRLTSIPNVAVVKPSYRQISVGEARLRQTTVIRPTSAAMAPPAAPEPVKRSGQPKFIFVE